MLLFLGALIYLDSFKLVSIRQVAGAMATGALAACLSYPLNAFTLDHLTVSFLAYSRYVSPWFEESLKAGVLVYLIRTRRVGLLVDGAIVGSPRHRLRAGREPVLPRVAAGGAVRGSGDPGSRYGNHAWRRHGMFAVVSVALFERRQDSWLSVFVPGLVAAVTLHSAHNHLLFRPILATLITLLALPGIIYFVFQRSEQSLREWLESDLDSDLQLLESINSGDFSATHAGTYLHSLKESFRGEVVADMLCYVRLHLELALRAKGILLMRAGRLLSHRSSNPAPRAKFDELRYLERSIGRTGKRAMKPFMHLECAGPLADPHAQPMTVNRLRATSRAIDVAERRNSCRGAIRAAGRRWDRASGAARREVAEDDADPRRNTKEIRLILGSNRNGTWITLDSDRQRRRRRRCRSPRRRRSTTASTRNCSRMSRWRGAEGQADADLAGPLGHRTSMMFMMPMPPTMQADTAAIPASRKRAICVVSLLRGEKPACDPTIGEVVVAPWWQPVNPSQAARSTVDHPPARALSRAPPPPQSFCNAIVARDAVPRCLDRDVDVCLSGFARSSTAPFIA